MVVGYFGHCCYFNPPSLTIFLVGSMIGTSCNAFAAAESKQNFVYDSCIPLGSFTCNIRLIFLPDLQEESFLQWAEDVERKRKEKKKRKKKEQNETKTNKNLCLLYPVSTFKCPVEFTSILYWLRQRQLYLNPLVLISINSWRTTTAAWSWNKQCLWKKHLRVIWEHTMHVEQGGKDKNNYLNYKCQPQRFIRKWKVK